MSLDNRISFDLLTDLVEQANVRAFKFDMFTFLDAGGEYQDIVEYLLKSACEVMLDLKLYNTRDSVERIARSAFETGAIYLTVFAAEPMLEAAMKAKADPACKVIGVGALSDGFEIPSLPIIPYAHCDGIVCSVPRANWLVNHPTSDLPPGKLLFTPGIRPKGSPDNNHVIPATPWDAAIAGSDFAIIGRPITAAVNPVLAAKSVIETLTYASRRRTL